MEEQQVPILDDGGGLGVGGGGAVQGGDVCEVECKKEVKDKYI